MNDQADFPEYDEYRPAKKMKLESALEVTEDTRDEMVDDEDGWDDIYGTKEVAADAKPSATELQVGSAVAFPPGAPNATDMVEDAKPADATMRSAPTGTLAMAPPENHPATDKPEETTNGETMQDGVPPEAIDQGDELVDEEHAQIGGIDEASSRMVTDISEIERAPATEDAQPSAQELQQTGQVPQPAALVPGSHDSGAQPVFLDALSGLLSKEDEGDAKPKPAEDPEFMAAAEAQKGNVEAEWNFDPSDAESSDDSSSDSSDSDSDSDSEGGYEMLDAATAAKILMAGEGDDDEGGGKGKKGTAHDQPRTANEVKEDIVQKPDVNITEDMKVTFLGKVENTVDNMALIKAHTTGEYQVLESGSVLCTKERKVLGAVGETFGRVQEPLYSIMFNSALEIEELEVRHGSEVFYVDSHSTFVFTQPLKNLKGTDASNIHDEEIHEDEMEFSDDEKEAEYKRAKKQAKKAGRGGLSRGAFNEDQGRTYGAPGHDSGTTYVGGTSDKPSAGYGGGMNYDDEAGGAEEEFYSPLKRPDNLSDLMAGGAPPPRPQHSFDRGRGRGRGDRGRGDRGRGRGDFGRGGRGGQRGGRGGFDRKNENQEQRGGNAAGENGRGGQHQNQNSNQNQNGGFKGNAQSFPDAHNNDSRASYPHALPAKPPVAPQQQYPPHPSMYQQPIPAPQQQPQQQSYQFNGYNFQYGNPVAPQAQAAPGASQGAYGYAPHPAAAAAPMPPAPGAFVNPAFYQQAQQQQQGAWPQTQPQQPAWNAGQYGQPSVPAQGQTVQQQDLADILRKLGHAPH